MCVCVCVCVYVYVCVCVCVYVCVWHAVFCKSKEKGKFSVATSTQHFCFALVEAVLHRVGNLVGEARLACML